MIELKEKAENYAEENVINVLKEAFAKVYADGYRDGYKDCEAEIPVDLRNNKPDYVDLGLPSGTLWSADYEKEENDLLYLPYCEAELLNIPAIKQWEELKNNCKWEFDMVNSFSLREARCVGPNGNTLSFIAHGKINVENKTDYWEAFFWIKDFKEGNMKSAAHMYRGKSEIEEFFSGYKLPIRLVKIKETK